MSNLRDHAIRELKAADLYEGNDMYDGMLTSAVLEIVDTFSKQGHSGASASICVSLLEKILRFEPVTPLTGEDDEWAVVDHDDGHLYAQNKRCGHVFKRRDGSAYDSEGRVFQDSDGIRYTSPDSRVDITFPYVPTSEIVEV